MQLDLNLLSALDALLTEGSVAGAAERLRLSSPAVSRTLGRLRRLTGDEILVRTGRTMTPTPYALAIQDRVHELVREAEAVLVPSPTLDLPELDRTFTLRCHDALATAIAPTLLTDTTSRAPNVRVRLLTEGAADTDDLRHGRVDLEIGAEGPDHPEIRSETIGHDRFVLVMSPDHPCAEGEIDLERYARQTHVLVSRRGRLADPVDRALTEAGLRRRVVAAVGSSAIAVHAVRQGAHVLTVPGAVCRPLIDAFGLVVRPLPVPLPPLPIVVSWHQRFDRDRAHEWLREEVSAALRTTAPGIVAPA